MHIKVKQINVNVLRQAKGKKKLIAKWLYLRLPVKVHLSNLKAQ